MSEYSPSWNEIFVSITTKVHESFCNFFNPFKETRMTEETQPREYREIRKWVKGFHRGSYNLVGFLMASYDKDTDSVRVGWSFCAPQDVFSKKVAENIARGRIDKMTTARIPKRYLDEVEIFVQTCETYYNTCDVYVCCGNTCDTDPGYFDEEEDPFGSPICSDCDCQCPLCQENPACDTCKICDECEEDCMECTKCDGCPEYDKIKKAVGDVEICEAEIVQPEVTQ